MNVMNDHRPIASLAERRTSSSKPSKKEISLDLIIAASVGNCVPLRGTMKITLAHWMLNGYAVHVTGN